MKKTIAGIVFGMLALATPGHCWIVEGGIGAAGAHNQDTRGSVAFQASVYKSYWGLIGGADFEYPYFGNDEVNRSGSARRMIYLEPSVAFAVFPLPYAVPFVRLAAGPTHILTHQDESLFGIGTTAGAGIRIDNPRGLSMTFEVQQQSAFAGSRNFDSSRFLISFGKGF